MNPLAFVLIAAVGYFASSVLRTVVQQRNEPKLKFGSIIAALSALATAGKGARKQGDGTYLLWPKGNIGGVTYDGAFATYIRPIEPSLTFHVTTFMYTKGQGSHPAWHQIEDFHCGAMDFGVKIGHVIGMSPDAKLQLMNARGQSGGSPAHPPR